MPWNNKGYTVTRINRKKRGEHDIIFEQYHKCCLLKWGLVHHKNEVRDDNRIKNLEGMTKGQHISFHHLKKPHRNSDYASRKCFECGSNKTAMRKKPSGYIHPKWYRAGNDWLCRGCYKRKHEQLGLWKVY